jgi:hypothetical protein
LVEIFEADAALWPFTAGVVVALPEVAVGYAAILGLLAAGAMFASKGITAYNSAMHDAEGAASASSSR